MTYFLENINNVNFHSPGAFVLLVIPALMLIFYVLRFKKHYPTLTLSQTQSLKEMGTPMRGYLKWLRPFWRILAVSALVVAIARPQLQSSETDVTTEGIDIVIATDVSTSMLARDFKPDRLEASKEVGLEFIESRPYDRIGLVVFAGESFTQCPITTDKEVLKEQITEIKQGIILDGTAIGMGLATMVNRLKDSQAKSKVGILLTDGVNNAGFVDPITASQVAAQFGIRVYTVGVGTQGKAYAPAYYDPFTGALKYDWIDVEIDEELLNTVADNTGGKYFRATDKDGLEAVYKEIDELEKTIIEEAVYTHEEELFYPFAFLALLFFFIEIVSRYTILRSLP